METQSDEILSIFAPSKRSIREVVGTFGCVLIGNLMKCLCFLTLQLCGKTLNLSVNSHKFTEFFVI